jgi:hypothetical protein
MTKQQIRLAAISLLTLPLCACAPKSLFYWGDYETSLYDRWLGNDNGMGEQHLQQTITTAEQGGRKVPPGLYADYGFLLYRRGNLDSAIAYFDKERKTFPESRLLMGKLIDKIHEKQKLPPTQDSQKTPEIEKKP